MTETLQLDEVKIIQMQLDDAPKLLIEWSSRWDEFVTSVGPALARSGPRLAGEAPHGVFPYRGMLASLLLQAFLLFVVAVLPRQIDRLRPYAAPKVRPYEVIYYSGDELPRTDDLGGSQSGATGRAGGQEAHHRTQTIRVARGTSLTPRVVDAPNLKLPSTTGAVANLLAFKSNPGPPPAEGLHSSLTAPSLPANVIAPPPVIARDRSRGALTLDSVVPPAPNISSDRSRTAPALNAAVVPPAPNVRSEHALVAPSLEASIIAPAPNISRERTLTAPSLNASVIGPASTSISREQARSNPALASNVIRPAPAAVGREVSPSRVQMNSVAVVPPPVSAPEREASRTAKVSLPAPAVVAPPPSADSTRDLRRLESGSAGASSSTVVPPPPTQAGSGFVSSIIGKLFGTQDVVPPPPNVSSGARNAQVNGLAANVVPPPPSPSSAAAGTASGTMRRTSLSGSIVPPPPSVSRSDTSGPAGAGSSRRSTLSANVVPPPPSVAGSGFSGEAGNRSGASLGNGLASNVVPPPPSVGTGAGLSGSGRKGLGLGGPGDDGSVLSPPKSAGGNRDNSGVVVSAQPGSSVGVPSSGSKGALAMSPSGGDKTGIGGSGAGASIGHGNGPGSGMTGEGSGAGKTGTAHGSDINARGGISPDTRPGRCGQRSHGLSCRARRGRARRQHHCHSAQLWIGRHISGSQRS